MRTFRYVGFNSFTSGRVYAAGDVDYPFFDREAVEGVIWSYWALTRCTPPRRWSISSSIIEAEYSKLRANLI